MNAFISSCVPADIAERQYAALVEQAEEDGREFERRVEEELAYLLRVPGDYCQKADEDMFVRLVSIITDRDNDKLGRLRDILDADMRRVAEDEARNV